MNISNCQLQAGISLSRVVVKSFPGFTCYIARYGTCMCLEKKKPCFNNIRTAKTQISTCSSALYDEGAYWFGPVCPSVCLSLCYACTLSITVRDRILKFGVWDEYEKLEDPYFFSSGGFFVAEL